jgi:hypothetical protein
VTIKQDRKAVVVAFMSAAVMGLASISTTVAYARLTERKVNHEWCDVAVPVSDSYKQTPPESEVGKALQRAMDDKRNRFC